MAVQFLCVKPLGKIKELHIQHKCVCLEHDHYM